MDKEIIGKTKQAMLKAVENMKKEFASIRTGRASASILDSVEVEYYGTSLGINKVANVVIKEARFIEVKPFDKNSAGAIEKAILKSNLGITPVNDGSIIRLEVPPLTEDRRVEFTGAAKKVQEEHKVELRNIRRQANEELKALNNSKELSEDLIHQALEDVQKLTDNHINDADKLLEAKTKEIMEV